MSLPTATSIRSGDLLDHYRLEMLVATGGMAHIFRATDTKTGRPVAIKIPHAGKLGDSRTLDRFQYETEIGRRLNHPGLVKVLPNEGASCRYAVTEWIEGQLLREILSRQGMLSVRRAIRITLAICDALEYIHGRRVVHGDLKPDNVMVDVADHIKLIDFGIAREAKSSLWKRARFEEAAGTPDYISPEQIAGKRTDARSDIYSLGIMLFEMLTGEVPFSGLDPFTAMNLRARVDPPTPCEINPDISPRLDAIVQCAIARDRSDRYASAREFASDLLESLVQNTSTQPLESFVNV
jgi:serine/threonine protein kinase